MAEQTPDSIITTQRNGQTIVAELFFNHSSTETFRDDTFHVRAVFIVKNAVFSKSRAGENTRKMPLLRNRGTERSLHENRAYQAGKDHRYLV